MRTSSRIKLITCGAAAAATVAALAGPSLAEPSGKTAPTETGCYDITGGEIVFERVKEFTFTDVHPSVPHGPDAGNLADHIHTDFNSTIPTYTSKFTDDARAVVTATTGNSAGLDCSGVIYRLRLFDEGHNLITDVVVPGNASDRVTWTTGFSYPDTDNVGRFAHFSATTETSRGRVVDTAPNDPAGLVWSLVNGGATSSFN